MQNVLRFTFFLQAVFEGHYLLFLNLYMEVQSLHGFPANIYLFKVNNGNTRKMWNMFKANNKNTRTKKHQFCCFYC